MILKRPPADAGGFSVINQRNKIRNNLIICFRGSVKKFVSLEENDSFLVRITI